MYNGVLTIEVIASFMIFAVLDVSHFLPAISALIQSNQPHLDCLPVTVVSTAFRPPKSMHIPAIRDI